MKSRNKVIVAACALGLLTWTLQAGVDYLFAANKSFLEVLLTDLSRQEMQGRMIVLFAFPAFGILTSRILAQREQAEQHSEYLNSLLRAIRQVNQYIAQEDDIESVLRGACDSLVHVRPYVGCGVLTFDDEDRTLRAASQAGKHTVSPAWSAALDSSAELPDCIQKALKKKQLVITKDTSECGNCPFHSRGDTQSYRTVTVPMQSRGHTGGVLMVTLEQSAQLADEEKWLLREVANDLAHARAKFQAEQQLRKSEQKYRSIFNSAHDAIYLHELEENGTAGHFVEVNQPACEMLGYSRDEFRQMTPHDITVNSPGEQTRTAMAELLENDQVTFEVKHRAKDGAKVPVEISAHLVHMADTRMVLSVARDITERKRAAEVHSQVIETAADGFWMVDLEGRIREVNESYCEMIGYSREELLGMSIGEIECNDSPVEMDERLHTIIQEGDHRFETRHRCKDGSIKDVEISASYFQPGGGKIFAFLRDITERKQAEKRLRIRDRAVQASLNGICIMDADGIIQSVNPATLNMWEYDSPSELLGNEAEAFWESPEQTRSIFQTAIDQGQWRGEMTAKQKDGFTFPVQAAFSTINDADGEIEYVVGVFRDISERKKAENRLREAYRELRETRQQMVDQERQRALSQMASGIAHDFNNALSPIRGYAELLLRSSEKLQHTGTVRRYLKDIKRAADQAAQTVRRMRKFYRPAEEWEHESLDINSVIKESISMARPRWQQEAQAHGVNIEMQTDLEQVPPIEGNKSELHEIFTNLIFNAVDAMEEDGTIQVSTRREDQQVCVGVQDTGHGMDEETLQHCMEPFYTTKRDTGTGLGLSVTQSIVRRHGGNMEVESEHGAGTTFRILFPPSDEAQIPEKHEVKPSQESESTETPSLQVLVVEDDQTQRSLVKQMLESDGHDVEVAKDGTEGLRRFSAGWYHVVLTDRAMPEVGGDQLATMVKDIAPEKPVVMLTGFGDMMEAAEESPEDVDAIISKPVSQAKLQRAFERVVDADFAVSEKRNRREKHAPEEVRAEESSPETAQDDIQTLLRRLHRQLQANDLDATDLAPKLSRQLADTACGEQAKELAENVHRFEFEPARELLHEIARELDISLHDQDA